MQHRDAISRRTILRRRLIAVAGTVAATALIWMLFSGGDEEEGGEGELLLTPAAVSAETEKLLAELDVPERARQLVLGAIPPGEPVAAESGAILIEAEAWPGEAAAPEYLEALRDAAEGPVPPLIAVRQEGGVYRELSDLPPNEREIEIGDGGDPRRALAWGEQTARALAAAGFDLNLAPVADIATLDSPVADRAFSDDPGVVTTMTAAAMRGCRRGELACAPSHFPGIGAASQDPDAGPATVSLDRGTLLARDAAPFVAAFEQGAPAVIISNAFYAAFDGVTPASLSPDVLDGLLRTELGFEGAAITDDLEAGAIRAGNRVPDAAVAAIVAGADMVQVSDPADVDAVVAALTEAAASGRISGRRLEDATARVLELKRATGVLGS